LNRIEGLQILGHPGVEHQRVIAAALDELLESEANPPAPNKWSTAARLPGKTAGGSAKPP
jgi:hypothetical protein